MNVEFLKLAEQELYDTQSYYENQQEKLGVLFKETIYKTLNRIVEFPMIYKEIKIDIRRCVVHKFPYSILYSIETDKILVIAIANQHRKPDYWVGRINQSSS